MIENLAAVLATEPELFRSTRLLNEFGRLCGMPDGVRERRRGRMTIA